MTMAGIRFLPDDTDSSQHRASIVSDLISDDDRSIAADSWSIKSEYGSTLDDEQRHADASEALAAVALRPPSDYSSSDKEDDVEAVPSMLGFQSYWNATYAGELSNFHEHGHSGEVWFGVDVMETVASWSKSICIQVCEKCQSNLKSAIGNSEDPMCWSVLDVGTGNGLLLQELSKQGFLDLTGIDYSEAAIDLARNLAIRNGFLGIKFMVDDVLDTKVEREFQLVLDKGTLDAVGMHPDGHIKRIMYWDSMSRLVASGGILIITSCNNTKDELVEEVETINRRKFMMSNDLSVAEETMEPPFQYLDHVRVYPTFTFGGVPGSRVATIAFVRNQK